MNSIKQQELALNLIEVETLVERASKSLRDEDHLELLIVLSKTSAKLNGVYAEVIKEVRSEH